MASFPIHRYLIAATPADPPPELTRVKQKLVRGLPAVVPLDATWNVAVLAPTGEARVWLDGDPSETVSSSVTDTAPYSAEAHAAQPLPARLILRNGSALVATLPLAAGVRRIVRDDGADGAPGGIELWLVGWALHAGCLRGPGDYGSYLDLAWGFCDRGSNEFTLPPAPPTLAERLVSSSSRFTTIAREIG